MRTALAFADDDPYEHLHRDIVVIRVQLNALISALCAKDLIT